MFGYLLGHRLLVSEMTEFSVVKSNAPWCKALERQQYIQAHHAVGPVVFLKKSGPSTGMRGVGEERVLYHHMATHHQHSC